MIDAHHHLWDPRAREYSWLGGAQPWASDEELARLRRPFTCFDLSGVAAGAGVSATVVIQTVNDLWETHDLLALAAGIDPYGGLNSTGRPFASTLLAGVVGWVDLTARDVRETIAQLRSRPGGPYLRGIRHPLVSESDPGWLTRPEVLNGLQVLATTGLAFDVVALPYQLGSVVTAAQSVPELSFVLDHMGGPPVEGEQADDDVWSSAIRRLGALSNVTCKLSGVHSSSARATTLRPYYDAVLEAFGPMRLMYGSDWPVSSLTATYGEVREMYRELTTSLTTAEQDAVFDHTARQVYGLTEPSA